MAEEQAVVIRRRLDEGEVGRQAVIVSPGPGGWSSPSGATSDEAIFDFIVVHSPDDAFETQRFVVGVGIKVEDGELIVGPLKVWSWAEYEEEIGDGV